MLLAIVFNILLITTLLVMMMTTMMPTMVVVNRMAVMMITFTAAMTGGEWRVDLQLARHIQAPAGRGVGGFGHDRLRNRGPAHELGGA